VELTNEFTVGVPVDEAWRVLTDLERIAPCMPGAQLEEVEGDEYRGVVKIKVGPITAQYKGVASFQERDEAAHRAVIKAEGRDTRGQGNASALVTATLEAEGDESTKVIVLTDLTVTGKVAQFGRGVMADVSAKLMDQFVKQLEADVLSGGTNADAAADAAAGAHDAEAKAADAVSSGPRKIDSKPAEPVDLFEHVGSPVAKRVGPIVGVLVVVLWLLRRRKKKQQR
jgi:carbon monoxide dehydrogenase subunit G